MILNNNSIPIKESNKLRLCGYCIAIKNRSKRFPTAYSLTWHLTHEHKNDIGIITPVKVSHPNTIDREVEN